MMKRKSLIVGLIAVAVIGVVIWQFGYFNVPSIRGPTSTGFLRIHPSLSTVQVTPAGDIFTTFYNGNKKPITLLSVESDSCRITFPNETIAPRSVSTEGEGRFNITGSGCDVSGDEFFIELNITYSIEVDGIPQDKTEYGTFWGHVKKPERPFWKFF